MKMVDKRIPRSHKLLRWSEVSTGQVVELITGSDADKGKLYMRTSIADSVCLNDGSHYGADDMGTIRHCLPMDVELHITGEKP